MNISHVILSMLKSGATTFTGVNLVLKKKTVIDVFAVNPPGKPVASIYPDDKYVVFHYEFVQIGVNIPEFKELLFSGEYEHNHT